MNLEKDIYAMELNDVIDLIPEHYDWSRQLRRVPGGWLIETMMRNTGVHSCFIPYNEEFKGNTVRELGDTL